MGVGSGSGGGDGDGWDAAGGGALKLLPKVSSLQGVISQTRTELIRSWGHPQLMALLMALLAKQRD